MVYRVSLNRKEIAIECRFAKSGLQQNPTVRTALKALKALELILDNMLMGRCQNC
jgi:hypothetical protein